MRTDGRTAAAALLLAGALAGCAAYEWTKEGMTEEAYLKDRLLCERHAQAGQSPSVRQFRTPEGPGGRPLEGGYERRVPDAGEETRRFVDCMEARGYKRARR